MAIKLLDSSTFQFLVLILIIGYFFGVQGSTIDNVPLLTFKEWWLSCLDAAKIYVAKEMVVYGSDAVKNRGQTND